MREIEVKARIANLDEVVLRIENMGHVVSQPVTQYDRVFGLPGADGGGNNQEPWLRIRTETKAGSTKHIFTLKRSVTSQLDSIEHETEVQNPDELKHIIDQLGFVPYMEITKIRRKTNIDDMEICIDQVERLGEFIEIEKLTDDSANYDDVIAELWKQMEAFGVTQDQRVYDGYDVLLEKLDKE